MIKHRIFLFFLFITTSTFSFGQYDSLIKPGKKWFYHKNCFPGEPPICPGGKISILPITKNYQGKVYYMVNAKACYSFDSIWAREEEKKVYFLNLGDSIYKGEEVLMYNFNLEKGDTFKFKTPYQDTFLTASIIVDTTFVKDNRKHIQFNNKLVYDIKGSFLPFHQIRSWVEGIGAPNVMLYYAFERHSFELFEYACYISCFYDGEKQILPVIGNCDSTLSLGMAVKTPITIFPNPAVDRFNIQLPSIGKYKLQIFNSLGQKLDELYLEGELNYTLPFDFYGGIYFLKVSSTEITYQSKLIVK